MNTIELIPQPAFELSDAAEKFRSDLNGQWSALQQKRQKALERRQELGGVAPELMNVKHIEELRKVKAAQAEIMRQELPLLRRIIDEWPALYGVGRDRAKNAAQNAYETVKAEITEKIQAMGFVDEVGLVQIWFFVNQNPRVRQAWAAAQDAAQDAATRNFDIDPLSREILKREEELRRAVEAAAA
jgi:hypothetical protein